MQNHMLYSTMRKHVFVATFLLFVAGKTSTMRSCFPLRHRRVYPIKQFVNCTEPVWTYRTSRLTRMRCQYDQMRAIDPLTIFFNRTMLIRGQRHSMQLRGDFDLLHADTMDVRTLGMQALSRETLIYLAPNLSCGVLKIGPVGRDTACYYDLRVKNSSIERIIDGKCWSHFYSVARQETHVYTAVCQHEVRPRK
uniref:Putative group i salivary lipocalin n=1 Tax=Rhipicephalus pulchellus TaxID=72859 RepID=L7LQL3_RHIPC